MLRRLTLPTGGDKSRGFRFLRFLQSSGMPIEATRIDKSHIRAFIRYLQTKAKTPRSGVPLSPATVQGYVRTLKAFFSWLDREGYVTPNVMARIPVPKAPSKVIDTFTTQQIARLVSVCGRSNGNGCPNLSILLLMLDSGLRVSEVAHIDLGDLNLAEGYTKISRAKGDRERIVPIGSLVQKLLWRYVNHVRTRPLTSRAGQII